MDLFPDAGFVRLRSSVWGTYLHADEDGAGVSLRPERATMNAVWKVHRIVRNDTPLLLLYGTAYGRYLATSLDPAPFGLRGRRVVQGVYDDLEQNTAVWSAIRIVARGKNVVQLQLVSHLFLLRANGKHFKRARTGVSVDRYMNRCEMMHWVVEAVPPLVQVPNPAVPPNPAQAPAPQVQERPRSGISSLFRKRAEPSPVRTIRYLRLDADGIADDRGWGTFQYHGRSTYDLRMELLSQRRDHFFFYQVTVCARPGRYGRLTPLIVDLPRSQAPMDVIAINHGPVEALLRYPNVNADPNADAEPHDDAAKNDGVAGAAPNAGASSDARVAAPSVDAIVIPNVVAE